ncbi:PREDICTED: odorant receptor 67c-like [Polistes dominula]|uniref:Odorant receptor n=1 Tax=Polistes dominula TaxID=743375 RepID=A0ABM1IK29_POLDO|nr:PREDICTED: odorant receptor 67c-like [Polistes dominula]
MIILKSTLTVLSFCGCWLPPSWSISFSKRLVYHLYTIFVALIISTLAFSQAIGIILNEDVSIDSSDDIYIFLAEGISCFKMLSLVINRNNIVNLISSLKQEPYKPFNDVETRIQIKFDNWSRLNTQCYSFLLTLSVSYFLSTSLLTNLKNKQLTFRVWLPFDNNMNNLIFYLINVHQAIALILGAMLHVALDCLIFGFLLHVCCQIQILENRLMMISNDNKSFLRLCIRHYDCICKFAYNVNNMFELMVFIQFFITTSTVCFTLYQLTKVSPMSLDFFKIILYMCCILMQIYLYCWYGNLVATKSEEIAKKIFEINWTTLNEDIKTCLLFMTKRTMKPIVLVVMKILPINLVSFVSILKTSYSAYNFMQQTDVQ